MKKLFTTWIILHFSLLAIGGTTINGSIYSGGIKRTYRLYIPTIYTNNHATPVPLVFNLHGYGSNPTDQQNYTNFMSIADTANFLMVLPLGTKDSSGSTFWNANFDTTFAVNDVAFLSSLIDSLLLNYNIDLNRIYCTGFSNGGFMSHYWACAPNRRIAAIASVSGTFFRYLAPPTPPAPIPVMQIHGTADLRVPIAGQADMVSADSALKFWIFHNQCQPTANFNAVPNTNTSDGCTAEHYVYPNSNTYNVIEYYKIIGGAHTWPGGIYNIGATGRDINASVEIWKFFRKYRLNQNTTSNQESNTLKNFKLFPNPASNTLQLHINSNLTENVVLKLYNTTGSLIVETTFTNHSQVNLPELVNGIYLANLYYKGQLINIEKVIIIN